MQKTNLNIAPYFDDFDESKNYHRILFRPRTVQARELNQLQSILQSQVSRFGDHMFEDGSLVIPGGVTVTLRQRGIEYNLTPGFTIEQLQQITEPLYLRSENGIEAKVLKFVPFKENFDPAMFIEYIDSGDDGEGQFFEEGQACNIFTIGEEGNETSVASLNVIRNTIGVWAKAKEGVYYVRGHFVRTTNQDVVISQDRENLDAIVGYSIREEIVTELQDTSLYSNALGEPNFKGPGASRLKITLNLEAKELDFEENDDFIEVSRVVNGELQLNVDSSNYSLIEKAIARRTYETHGNYTVEAFGAEVKNHLKEHADDNDGVFLPENGGDEDKFVVQIKPGIGYTEGYRIESIGLENLVFDRARETKSEPNTVTSAQYGPYILIENVKSFPEIDIRHPIRFLNSGGSPVGTASVRAARRESDAVFRLYIFDLKFTGSNTFHDAARVDYQDLNNFFTANLVSNVIFDSSKDILLFPLPYSGISTVRSSSGSAVSYSIVKTFNVGLNASGTGSISLSAAELFEDVNNFEYVVAYTGAGNTGQHLVPSQVLTLGGSPVGRTLTINAGAAHANKEVKIVAPIIKTSSAERSKTLQTTTINVAFDNENKKQLNHNDISRINSIRDITDRNNPIDITNMFRLDNGQRASWYQRGSIETRDGRKVNIESVEISYDYFEHGTGDYFSVDSYTNVGRERIPNFGGVSLADVYDFRQDKDASGAFSQTSPVGDNIKPGTSIRANISLYLPRVDSIYLTASGEFKVARGNPSLTPNVPEVPLDSMRLYDVIIPQYTTDVNDVFLRQIENKRYTMRDIGKLEKRIDNVEYYTTLSMLEGKVNSMQIIDPDTGNNRFKNGFAVDGFQDFSLSETENDLYRASVDMINGTLNPTFMLNDTKIEFDSGSNYHDHKGEFYSLPYTEKRLINQPIATRTININPYAVFTWSGMVDLTPNEDFWRDVVYLPPIQKSVTINERGNAREGTFTNLIGTSISNSTRTETRPNIRTIQIGGSPGNDNDPGGGTTNRFRTVVGHGNYIDTITTTTRTETFETVVNKFTSNVVNSLTGDNLVRETPIYFMRSIDIRFDGMSLRPHTRVYPFFDGIAVGAVCKPYNGNYGEPLITDAQGNVMGIFTVPNSPDFNFKTGTSTFRLTDNAKDLRGDANVTTFAEGTFKSGGVTETRQKEFTQTTTLGVQSTSVLSQTSTIVGTSTKTVFRDPIAQTFMIPGSDGNIITRVGIKFMTKARDIPVTLEIRPVENGIPTNFVLNGGTVILNPDQVKTSADASVYTYFEFSRPLFLEQHKEYAIVLLAETQEYNVYIAQMGDPIIGQNSSLGKQANMGVFFHSANGSTWTAAQTQDLTFELYGAEYDVKSEAQIVFANTDVDFLPTAFNPIETTKGSGEFRLYHRSHGLLQGDTFTIRGAVAGNGITAQQINATHTVISSTIDHVVFSISGASAEVTGTMGGGDVLVQANYPITSFYAFADVLELANTSAFFEVSYLDQATRMYTDYAPFVIREDGYLGYEGVVTKAKDFKIRVTLRTESKDLTPILYAPSMGAVFKSNRINNDVDDAAYSYITRDIKFDNPSTSARFYIGAGLPSSTDMRLYYKLFLTSDEDISQKDWVELAPNEPLTNSDRGMLEYRYDLEGVGSFVGYKILIKFLGTDPVMVPRMSDFRSIALA